MSLEEGARANEFQLQGLHFWLDNQRNFLCQTGTSPDRGFSISGAIQAKSLFQGFCRSHFFIEVGGGIEPNDIWGLSQIYDYAIV